ncbi:hypothetical protein ATO4_24686 [Aurantimonas sp. 22II-16-19i]|nr:hypothetical protein ATO4_24686 [Aurantimonas sp. 22II-16-19i]
MLLYAGGWLLVGLSVFIGAPELAGRQPEWVYRIGPDRLLAQAGFCLLAATVGAMVLASLRLRRFRYLPGIVLNGLVVAFVATAVFSSGFFGEVCGQRKGCYFLSIAPAPTDTIYEIWRAPAWWSPVLVRLKAAESIHINYSEDGSYTSDPHLLLSNDEQILVLARGGYLVDAIDLASGRVLSDFIGWGEPDRDALMRQNSDAIAAIAASHGGLADR